MRTINPMNLFSLRSTGAPIPTAKPQSKSSASGTSMSDAVLAKDKSPASLELEREVDEEGEPILDTLYEGVKQENEGSEPLDEKVPLLGSPSSHRDYRSSRQTSVLQNIAGAMVGSFRVIIAAVLAPGRFLIACFYDDHGRFSAMMPFIRFGRAMSPKSRSGNIRSRGAPSGVGGEQENTSSNRSRHGRKSARALSPGFEDKTSAMTSDSEVEGDSLKGLMLRDSPARNTRSQSSSSTMEDNDDVPPKRSIRYKVVSQDELRRRKQKRSQGQSTSSIVKGSREPPLTVATIKSPTGSASTLGLTKYPQTPAPPRPLIPRRQPSYSTFQPSSYTSQKTLVIDLDETLIHSMAKGGRMSTGHMVEVKLSSPVGVGNTVIAPQVPILYYVHKRPFCDEFLRKVSRWYNLVVFTASVQEYADPVIDWLELERKYFSARYYRQHCIYRNGAYIKDLSQVEPDLSKVMILDNSPLSYIFHEDNAIPIEGWISDPTDNDLLHLIPLLEGLQYTSDVRALLALRLGESVP